MKFLSRLARDVSLQFSCVAALGALVFCLWHGASPARSDTATNHGKTCHACAAIPPGEASRFEEYLLKNGIVDRAREDD